MGRKLIIPLIILSLYSLTACKRHDNPSGPEFPRETDSTCGDLLTRTVIPIGVNKDSAILQVPCHYATETAKYPLLLFLNGALEGSQYGNLSKLMTVGPPVFIADSMRFAFDVAGTNYKMIVVAPQSPTGFRNPQAINTILDYMISHYRVDETRIYLTGVSAGAQSVLTYLSDNVDNAKRIAAAAPMSSTELDATHINNLKIIGQQGVHTQIFCGDADGKYFNANKSYVDGINQGASGMGIFTTYSGSHGEWNNQYDPSHRYRNPNVYEWLLQFHR